MKRLAKKRALGKGLGALIPSEPVAKTGDLPSEQVQESTRVLPIDEIMPNEEQPRKNFEPEALRELADSIAKHGLIQPIVVRKRNQYHEIVAGERRWRASKMIGLKEVNVVIMDVDDDAIAQLALVENLQREDLNPVEEASAYKELSEKHGMNQSQIADSVGKSRSHIANTMRLLGLDRKTLGHLASGMLSAGHARTLLVAPEKERGKWVDWVIKEQPSVRELEKRLKSMEKKTTSKERTRKPLELISFEETLASRLGTKVKIKHDEDKGKIEISYFGTEDLNRLLELLKA